MLLIVIVSLVLFMIMDYIACTSETAVPTAVIFVACICIFIVMVRRMN